MFDKFGEFDSVEELNRAASAQLEQEDTEAILAIAEENGIDKEDAEDYIDGMTEELATSLMAALGKLKVEEKELGLEGILKDWKDAVMDLCMNEDGMQQAVRRKGKNLRGCMAALIKFSFESKVQVSDKIVKATRVMHNGKEEPMREPLYLGIPNKADAKQIIRNYYLGGEKQW